MGRRELLERTAQPPRGKITAEMNKNIDCRHERTQVQSQQRLLRHERLSGNGFEPRPWARRRILF